MVMTWQRELPEAQGSVLHPTPEVRELYRSEVFTVPGRANPYQVRIHASWGDECRNGSNSFYLRAEVVIKDSNKPSEYADMDMVPPSVAALIPWELLELKKWNGCHPFGPWYYIENTVFLAGDKDCNGLRAGERRQILRGGDPKFPCWHLVGIGPDGEEIPHYKLGLTHDGEKPTSKYALEWRAWEREGEGKKRELESARSVAIWPEATDAQLCAPDLAIALQTRLPGLLVEFRRMIESLGMTW